MLPSLQELCFRRLVALCLCGADPPVEFLPEDLARELLLRAAAQPSDSPAGHSRAWACFARRRPPAELHLLPTQCWEGPAAAPRLGALPPEALLALRQVRIGPAPDLTDATLAPLGRAAPWLACLRLRGCPRLLGGFLKEFAGHPQLRSLFCSGCPGLGDAAVAQLAGLPLTQLGLSGAARLSDATAAALCRGAGDGALAGDEGYRGSQLPRVALYLRHLDLSGTALTDEGAGLLGRLPALDAVLLSRTAGVSAGALRKLASALGLSSSLPDRPRVLVRTHAAAASLLAVERGSPSWGDAPSAPLAPEAAHAALSGASPREWPEVTGLQTGSGQ